MRSARLLDVVAVATLPQEVSRVMAAKRRKSVRAAARGESEGVPFVHVVVHGALQNPLNLTRMCVRPAAGAGAVSPHMKGWRALVYVQEQRGSA